ncbi:hypothetical protein OCGS_1911 [Oceaniovalibus guishaninsula JLT2003]|uniref:Uncharacterized protein n=1 Tax=Oceaniovalibus guishaninsula JLT2003 TaxID=1231392 RepID=K2I4T3_9RHOB|nr:DUF6653 family protein [Oceaniovalibus guishaninsula]EKE43930.1 hypothetical protein OCGS_1911 [Oceaniovalibus guishaninsula JLT2003]
MLAYRLVLLNGWAVLGGLTLTLGAKLWFIDRMVRLWQDRGGR